MKKAIVLMLVGISWTTGFSQSLSFKFGTPFQRTDLDVRWNALSNAFPTSAWIYRLLPNQFSPSAISCLMALGPFTQKDMLRSNANEILFVKPGNAKNLSLSFHIGAIGYQTLHAYGPTNLAKAVPQMAELPQLTTNFLKEIGISISDIEKKPDGSPNFHFSEPLTEYFVSNRFITNIAFRTVSFRRSVDGASWTGANTGGDCDVEFGEYGKPSMIWLSWRNLQRYKVYSTATPSLITNWIRHGKAVQNMISMDAEPINWRTIKSLTVTEAKLSYYAGGPFEPSDWLMPFVALWTTVDTGIGKINVEIDCPIIDETKPPLEGNR
jgi:hypothetical protein